MSRIAHRFRVVEDGFPYFITATIVKWLPVFVIPAACDIVVESLRHCRSERGLRMHGYVIMPTHMHVILSMDGDLSGVLRDFKKFTSKRIVELHASIADPPFRDVFEFCGRDNRPATDHKVWQDGSHAELIKSEAFFRQKLDYLHANPHRKGLVVDPLAWTYSSARCCAGTGDGPLEIDWIDW